MCIKIINWVKYYTKTIYLASQYMHLDAPRTACLCMDTCSSKQTQYHQSILQQQLLLQLVQCRCSIVIARDRAVYPSRELTRNRKPDHSFGRFVALTV